MNETDHPESLAWFEEAAVAADARGRLRARFALVLAGFVILWTFGEGVGLWRSLPDQIPVHFGLRGEPDGWSPKGAFSVFGILIIAAGELALLASLASLRIGVRYWNLPRKDLILTLPRALQEHVIAPVRESIIWLAAAIAIGMSLLCRQSWAVALGRRETISVLTFLLPLAIGIAAAIVGTMHVYRRVGRLESEA